MCGLAFSLKLLHMRGTLQGSNVPLGYYGKSKNSRQTVQTTAKWEAEKKKTHKPGIPKADADLILAAEENAYLYMRSMSISGSFWNSFIFTVSERILFRFLRSSSTCGDRNQ